VSLAAVQTELRQARCASDRDLRVGDVDLGSSNPGFVTNSNGAIHRLRQR
jgi:hypothetical protein